MYNKYYEYDATKPTYSTNKFSIVMGSLANKKSILYGSLGLSVIILIESAILFPAYAFLSLIPLLGTFPKLIKSITALKTKSELYYADIEKYQIYKIHKNFAKKLNKYNYIIFKLNYKITNCKNLVRKSNYSKKFEMITDEYSKYIVSSINGLLELKEFYLKRKDVCKNYIKNLNNPNSEVYIQDVKDCFGNNTKQNIYDYIPNHEINDELNFTKNIKNNTNEIISYIDKLLTEYSEIFKNSKTAMNSLFKPSIENTLSTEQIKERVRQEYKQNYGIQANEKYLTEDPLFKKYMTEEINRKEFINIYPSLSLKNPNKNFTNPYIDDLSDINASIKSMNRNDKKTIKNQGK